MKADKITEMNVGTKFRFASWPLTFSYTILEKLERGYKCIANMRSAQPVFVEFDYFVKNASQIYTIA